MEKVDFLYNIKKCINNPKMKIILFNLLYLVVLLLLFEPTAKSDDYDMANLSFGGIDEEYSPFILYSNVLFGYILKYLMLLFPSVSWFYVLQYILLFGGFCIITYIFYKKNTKKVALVLSTIFLLIAGYEFYIRITFSKTSGFLLSAGYILLLYLIDKENKSIIYWLLGFIYIFFGIIIRAAMFIGITGVFVSSFFIFCYKGYKKKSENLIKKIVQFVITVICLYLCYVGTSNLNSFLYNTDDIWGSFYSDNDVRGRLVDFGIPNYDTYEDDYKNIGVSKNDYLFWFQLANRGDKSVLTNEVYEKIIELRENIVAEDDSGAEKIMKAIHSLLNYQKANTMFYLLIIAAICFLFIVKKSFIFVLFCTNGMCVLAYLYLSYNGRTQHHVDASLYLAGALVIFYFIESNIEKIYNIRRVALLVSLVTIVFVNSFYGEIVSSSYYGTTFGTIASQKEQYEKRKEILSLFSDNERHLYVIAAKETNVTYPCFTVFEPIEKGFYHNIYRPNMNHIPVFENVLKDFGIENLWNEITNSNDISYIVSDYSLSDISIVQTYIQEHYSPNAKSVLAKQIEDMYVYRFIDDTFTIDISNVQDGSQVINSIDKVFDEVGNVIISGYAFIDGKDSFAQNLYIQVVNKKTKEYKTYTCLQTENEEYDKCDKYSGKYSAFSCTISKEILNESKLKEKNVKFNLLLEIDNQIYQIPID